MRNLMLRRCGSKLLLLSCFLLPLAGQEISDAARQQIADVLRMKRALSASQRKLSTDLILAVMKTRGQNLGTATDLAAQSADVPSADGIVVDIESDSVADAMTQINAVGGTILPDSSAGAKIRAQIPVLSLEAVAASPAVRSIHKPYPFVTNSVRGGFSPFQSPTASLPLIGHSSHRLVQAEIESALPLLAANGFYPSLKTLLPVRMRPFIGAITSQGYATHGANQAVDLGYDGTGVRIGVISDSATPARVAALIATGDLPVDTVVVPGKDGGMGSDEGTAMMEIIHDLAPGSKLFFATAKPSPSAFASNIRLLRDTYRCDIIVDDVSYFNEPAFQDGPIAQAVNAVTADGALYFSSAANSGNLTRGTSGTWEGDFQPGGDAGLLIDSIEGGPVPVHNFSTTNTLLPYDTLTGPTGYVLLHWSDPVGASSNDYDLFVLNPAGTAILGLSIDIQSGFGNPIEGADLLSNPGANFPVGSRIVVVLNKGTTRALHIDTERGRLSVATSGATIGHNAGLNTVTMAATAWNSARRGAAVFTSANPTETFSSDGPRKIFYTPTGAPITPGNVLFGTDGGTTLQKPDLTAADGIYTKTPGFLPFFGTSAAAPHAAAIAALVKSANPALTNVQIRQILIDTAVDTMAPGVDRDSGYGIMLAAPAVQAALTTP